MKNKIKNILFLCTGNSCRSQMAEGWAKHLKGKDFNFYSAGTVQHGLNPRAVAVMREAGIDISKQVSKTTADLEHVPFDLVFTLCDNARESCPVFFGAKIIHVGFEDPPYLTRNMENEEEILAIYRKVRDQIRDFINNIDLYIDKANKGKNTKNI